MGGFGISMKLGGLGVLRPREFNFRGSRGPWGGPPAPPGGRWEGVLIGNRSLGHGPLVIPLARPVLHIDSRFWGIYPDSSFDVFKFWASVYTTHFLPNLSYPLNNFPQKR